MALERKTARLSARLPATAIARVDFVVRNLDIAAAKNRSSALLAALEAWLPNQEKELERLGILTKKAR